jgi:hypothetical protein
MTTETRKPREVCWTSHVGQNDDFGAPIKHEVGGIVIDGKTKAGPWALMNPTSHQLFGCGLGLGLGQKYVKQADGRWLKTEG